MFFVITKNLMQSDGALTKCLVNQQLRNGKCCIPVECRDEGFEFCRANNSSDICTPCPEDEYVSGTYSTVDFSTSPCVKKRKCLPEEITNEHGVCVCDRANGYFLNPSKICEPALHSCDQIGLELDDSGSCLPCNSGFFKDESGPSICRAKSNISCLPEQTLVEGGPSVDRKCIVISTQTVTHTTVPTLSSTSIVPNEGLSIEAIIGLAFGCSIVVLVLVLAIVFVRKKYLKKKRKKRPNKDEGNTYTETVHLNAAETEIYDETIGDTIEENSFHYVSGGKSTENHLEAIPFDDDDLPFADETVSTEGAVGGTEINNETTDQKTTNTNEVENSRSMVTVAVQVHDELDSQQAISVEAEEHDNVVENSLPVLSAQPENDDVGRLTNGPWSFPVQNGGPNRPQVIPNGRAADESIDVSMPSTEFEQIRPDIHLNQNTTN